MRLLNVANNTYNTTLELKKSDRSTQTKYKYNIYPYFDNGFIDLVLFCGKDSV